MSQPIRILPIGTRPIILTMLAADVAPIQLIPGPRGPAGGGGALNIVRSEVPLGNLDGVNMDYTLVHAPLWLHLIHNGTQLFEDVHYTLVGNAITLNFAPAGDDSLLATYIW